MALRFLLAAAAVAALAAAPGASACTVEPIGFCVLDLEAAQACAWGPCPPATNGGAYVRVLDRALTVPFPG